MKISIIGMGPIGSTFAFQLANKAHDVTVIARGERLEQLKAKQSIITLKGGRVPVTVSDAFDSTISYDLVLVTVLASQVDILLPSLKVSAAKKIMFMFNTFDLLHPLCDAVGKGRFAFGFPAILASFVDEKLKFKIYTGAQTTITTDSEWATIFTKAGILTVVHNDIESWLRTHAVMIGMRGVVGSITCTRQAGLSWAEARTCALAMREGFALVKQLKNTITPFAMAAISWMPVSILTSMVWVMSRLKSTQASGENYTEGLSIIDMMIKADPAHTLLLQSIRA